MFDHKHDRSTDRQITLGDIKQRMINLLDNPFVLPEEDIYDEPLRYYKLNLKWAPIIFGWLDWLEDLAGWQNADDENYSGIQQVLKFEEGIDIVTPDELKGAISDGMYKAFNDLAKQIVSGRTTNINVDENSVVTSPSEDTQLDEFPEDDPLTSIDENKAANAGCAITQAVGVQGFLDYIDDLYGPIMAVPENSQPDALKQIQWLYVTEAPLDAGLTAYYNYRQLNPQLPQINEFNLAQHIYCDFGEILENVVVSFFAASTTISTELKEIYIGLVQGLAESQYKLWCNKGSKAPSTDYLAYECEPIPDYEFTIQWGAPSINDTHTWKKNHRVLVTVEGHLLDPDGDIQDAWWHKQVGQIEIFDTSDFNIQQGGATKIDPTSFEAPYNAAHKYTWTIDMGATDANPQWTLNRDLSMAVASSSPSGGLLIKVHDLGEIS